MTFYGFYMLHTFSRTLLPTPSPMGRCRTFPVPLYSSNTLGYASVLIPTPTQVLICPSVYYMIQNGTIF